MIVRLSLHRASFAQLAARLVEDTVAIGREYHYRFPMRYDVGFKLNEPRPGHGQVMLRIDDYIHAFEAVWPPNTIDRDPFLIDMSRGCSAAVFLWADKHPEYKPLPQDAQRVAEGIRRLGDDGWNKLVLERARKRREMATFTAERSGPRA